MAEALFRNGPKIVMENQIQSLKKILEYLQSEKEPLVLKQNGTPPVWSDEHWHRSIFESDPELYALLALAPGVEPWQRVRILFQLLKSSLAGLTPEVRKTLNRVIAVLLVSLHPHQVLTVFLALRRVRANHKHTSRAILRYVLNHPCLDDLAVRRRPTLVDCLEQALGRNVARACAKYLVESTGKEAYVQRNLLRFANQPEQVKSVIPFLFRPGRTHGQHRLEGWLKKVLPFLSREQPEVTESLTHYSTVHVAFQEALDPQPQLPQTVTATNRGDISATLIHMYRGGSTPELEQALSNYVEKSAAQLPVFEDKLALVLDASASTRGYGSREYCCISQSVALKYVLEKCFPKMQVFQVGGLGDYPPLPHNATDLAGALLNALDVNPDVVAIVSDGYENVNFGDLARVVATLPQVGIDTPVMFCHSKFSRLDDLALRRPATNLEQVEFWHEQDFVNVLVTLLCASKGEHGQTSLRNFLERRLEHFERGMDVWISKN